MSTGSGLDAQLGVAEESVFGTIVTPARFYEFNEEGMALEFEWLEPAGLRAGAKFKRSARVIASRRNVSGSLTLEHATRGMGLLWKHALGSTSTIGVLSGTAYEQIHTPGDYRGKSLTVQVGRPEPSTGTVVPFTFSGCKVATWTLNVSDGDIVNLALDIDGRDQATATALASASYVAGNQVWGFHQAVLKLGGTATTASGKTTVAGGTTVATIITELTAAGESPKATERYGLGNAGLKAEQLENDIPTLTGSLSAEFSKTELYDIFTAKTTTPMQLILTGDAITGGLGATDVLELTWPAVKLKTAAPAVGGPDLVQADIDFEAYSDGTNPPVQVRIVSLDSAI